MIVLAFLALSASGCVEYTRINEAVLASANVERRLEKINGMYRLGATDVIQVTVRNAPDVSGSNTIRPDGYVTLDLLGDVYVEGMTPMQVADMLTRLLQVYVREADFTCRVVGFNSKKYYVFGETAGVGEQVFDGDVTVLRAFARARGVTNQAAWDRIRVIRATTHSRQIFKINLGDIVKQGRWETNIQLKQDDIVYVPPTYVAQVAYFIDNLLFPVTHVLRNVLSAPGALAIP